jgi:hypothetical protein
MKITIQYEITLRRKSKGGHKKVNIKENFNHKVMWAMLKIRLDDSYICKIWGFHGDDYEECRLVRCQAMWLS